MPGRLAERQSPIMDRAKRNVFSVFPNGSIVPRIVTARPESNTISFKARPAVERGARGGSLRILRISLIRNGAPGDLYFPSRAARLQTDFRT